MLCLCKDVPEISNLFYCKHIEIVNILIIDLLIELSTNIRNDDAQQYPCAGIRETFAVLMI